MVRAPCCEKMGLKKGPWTPEEDQILINYIKLYGHGNWRALPKQAGLLRCGKSCRLRWTNYLRPDIKRGNFTREEEDTIIKLHEMLGNRWSAIAARLPGRTDNEIKNVWHTHLKKRLKQNNHSHYHHHQHHHNCKEGTNKQQQQQQEQKQEPVDHVIRSESTDHHHYRPVPSPQLQECSSDDMSSVSVTSSVIDNTHTNTGMKNVESLSSDNFVEIDDNFWTEVLSADNSSIDESDFSAVAADPLLASAIDFEPSSSVNADYSSNFYDSMDFWYNLFTRAGDASSELPDI